MKSIFTIFSFPEFVFSQKSEGISSCLHNWYPIYSSIVIIQRLGIYILSIQHGKALHAFFEKKIRSFKFLSTISSQGIFEWLTFKRFRRIKKWNNHKAISLEPSVVMLEVTSFNLPKISFQHRCN